MNENLKAFIQKVVEDPEVAAKLTECKTEEEAYAFASGIQDGFTAEEFSACMKDVLEKGQKGELSDDDLMKIAGGVDWEAMGEAAWKSAVTGAVGGVSCAAAFAAASI